MAAHETTKTPAKAKAPADVVDPKPTNFADDDNDGGDKEDDGENLEGDAGLDVGAVVKAIEGGTISVADMDAILAAIQSQSAAEGSEATDPAPAPAPIEAMRADRKNLSAFAALQGEVDALKANEVNRSKAAKRKDEVADAVELLRGLPLGSDLEGNLFKFHEAHGGAAFGDYVQSLKRNTAVDPGDRSEIAANFMALGGKFPDAAMKYQDQGTEAVQRAAAFDAEFDDLAAVGSGMKTTRGAYIALNMAHSAT